MSNYDSFAEVYDSLMCDVNYTERTEYLLKLFDKYDRKPTLLLDLACGTGGFSNELAKRGIEIIGVDASQEMLSSAFKKSEEAGTDVFYLCQRAEYLDLYGTVDGAICCLDSLNHITDYADFSSALQRVGLFLEKGRLFIFDVNTVYKHKHVLADNTYIIEENGVYCAWQNFTDEESHVTDIVLDFFKEENGVYRRFGEEFSERAYTEKEIENAAAEAGLEILAVLDDITGNPITETSERAVYVTRKVKEA